MTDAERRLIRELRDLQVRLDALRLENRRLEKELAWLASRGPYVRIIRNLRNGLYAQRQRTELWKHRALREVGDDSDL